ncbi:MAG: rRNA maturation RNase YbeY [Cyanobacteria bacterium J06592_8]
MNQVLLEVNVQDCFWLQKERESAASCPISASTWETWFTQWFQILHPNIPPAECYELSLRLTDNTEITQLNYQYRSIDIPTDVLAFATLELGCPQIPVSEVLASDSLYLGDIVISVETAVRQAQQQGHSLTIELGWLAAHGFLHLLGWDHQDRQTLIEMLDRQEIMLNTVGLKVNTQTIRNVNLAGYSQNSSGDEGNIRKLC